MYIFAQKIEPAKYFFNWTCVHLIMSQQKSPKVDFQSQFSMSKISFIILSFFLLCKIIGEQLIVLQFVDDFIF